MKTANQTQEVPSIIWQHLVELKSVSVRDAKNICYHYSYIPLQFATSGGILIA